MHSIQRSCTQSNSAHVNSAELNSNFNTTNFKPASIQFRPAQVNSVQPLWFQFNPVYLNSIQLISILTNSVQIDSMKLNSTQYIWFSSGKSNSVQWTSTSFNLNHFKSIRSKYIYIYIYIYIVPCRWLFCIAHTLALPSTLHSPKKPASSRCQHQPAKASSKQPEAAWGRSSQPPRRKLHT